MHARHFFAALTFCAFANVACSSSGGGGYYFPDDAGDDVDDAAPDDTQSNSDVATSCQKPRLLCNGSCVDPFTDLRNCGACGRLCASGQSCDNGVCSGGMPPSCPPPRALCGTSCIDTLNDNDNCGACGRACPTGQTCNDGACRSPAPACAAPRTMCGTSCVDTQTDRSNCGGCGRSCASTQNCTAGVCAAMPPTCAPPRMMCSAGCIDVTGDVNNCGFCGVRCTAGQTCSMGLCFGGSTCAAPRTMCGTACVDTSTDLANCGVCGVRCATGQTCTAGRCQTSSTGTGSRAGAVCTNGSAMGEPDPACGALLCFTGGSTPFCTDGCTDSTSQAVEQSMCGGAGSTCLTQGDAPDDSSLCVAACRPTGTSTATGACRAGMLCTGWWFTHATLEPDATGCTPFCANNTQCTSGRLCNPRTGDCDSQGLVSSRLADGLPCNPTLTTMVPGETTPRNTQCRGLCFTVSDTATQGICGSLVNLATTSACPDTPAQISPLVRPGADNLGLCLFKSCTVGADCAAPLICRYPESATGTPDTTAPKNCEYPTRAQPRSV